MTVAQTKVAVMQMLKNDFIYYDCSPITLTKGSDSKSWNGCIVAALYCQACHTCLTCYLADRNLGCFSFPPLTNNAAMKMLILNCYNLVQESLATLFTHNKLNKTGLRCLNFVNRSIFLSKFKYFFLHFLLKKGSSSLTIET